MAEHSPKLLASEKKASTTRSVNLCLDQRSEAVLVSLKVCFLRAPVKTAIHRSSKLVAVHFSLMASAHSGKRICAPLCLSEASSMLRLKQFHGLIDDISLSRPLRVIVERFLFLRLSPSGDWSCDILGFVPKECVSSSSTL